MPVDLSEKEIKSNLEFLREHLPSRPTAVDGLYQLPKNLSDDVLKTNFSQNSLQKISDHIGYFLGILKSIKVNFVAETTDPRWIASNSGVFIQDDKGSSTSGLYRVMGYDHSEILLIKKQRYKLKHLLAILAHEYTHHYLYEHGVKKDETSENEILTEIATAFLGIGQFLVEGYHPITWTSDYYNYVFVSGHKVHTMTLGYVTPATIRKAIILATELRQWKPKEVVRSFKSLFDKLSAYIKLIPYRSEIRKDEKREREATAIRNELVEIKEKYKDICSEFGKIIERVNSMSISKKDGAKFVILANEISQGNFGNKIENLFNVGEDVNKLNYIKKQKNQLMDQIIVWQKLLVKYSNINKKTNE